MDNQTQPDQPSVIQPGQSEANQQPPAEVPEGGNAPKPKSGLKWLWWLILIVFIILALLLGWWWKNSSGYGSSASGSDSSSMESSEAAAGESEEEAAVLCEEEQVNFQDETLGLGFCYPETWGDATVADAKLEPADTGTRWSVTFDAKPEVMFGVISDDWSTAVIRDFGCADVVYQTLPAFSPFSTAWTTETGGGAEAVSGSRGIEVAADEYLIVEEVDDLLSSGVCLRGHQVLGEDSTYPHTTATYFVTLGAVSVDDHIAAPNVLVSEADREDFYAFVQSAYAL